MISDTQRVRPKREEGFTLVEVIVSMLIMLVGLISVAELFALAMRDNSYSFNNGAATIAAQDKIEELRGLDFDNAQLQLTGSPDPLTSNVADHNDAPGNFIRRWSVTAGPTPDTRIVTVRIISTITDPRRAKQQMDITTILVRPQE
ncbi:MAG TPA: prepilin-type N-terminal cleavage/methylation domain-containing protein [Blastocatellia bacterium]|nr:prepilin-type N-terminal cleavage/methylation domain-containing protein [Blastocatellia bacterium]